MDVKGRSFGALLGLEISREVKWSCQTSSGTKPSSWYYFLVLFDACSLLVKNHAPPSMVVPILQDKKVAKFGARTVSTPSNAPNMDVQNMCAPGKLQTSRLFFWEGLTQDSCHWPACYHANAPIPGWKKEPDPANGRQSQQERAWPGPLAGGYYYSSRYY